MTCQFGVLGDVHIRRDGQELYPGPPQQSAVLARLLVAEGRPVTTDELVNGIWGRDIPKIAVVTVRTYISRFRNILGATSGYTIPFTRAGYLPPVDESSLDLLAFHARVAAARQLVGVGEPRSALGQLDDALALYRDVRAMFLDELGIEPGRDLRDLRQRILRADPDLLLPTVGARRHLGFVGRSEERRVLGSMLAHPGARCCSSTGRPASGSRPCRGCSAVTPVGPGDTSSEWTATVSGPGSTTSSRPRRRRSATTARRSSSTPSNAARGWSSGYASRSFPISHPVLL